MSQKVCKIAKLEEEIHQSVSSWIISVSVLFVCTVCLFVRLSVAFMSLFVNFLLSAAKSLCFSLYFLFQCHDSTRWFLSMTKFNNLGHNFPTTMLLSAVVTDKYCNCNCNVLCCVVLCWPYKVLFCCDCFQAEIV